MDSKPVRPTASRRFTLLDGMILVSVIAIVLAPTRWIDPDDNLWTSIDYFAANFTWDWGFFDRAVSPLQVFAMTPSVAFTLGVLAMRLRKPRPPWRRLVRQPGLAACLALLLGLGMGAAFTVVNLYSDPGAILGNDPRGLANTFSAWGCLLGGFAVVVAWATLALVGCWRAEPNWLDRLGRLVGLAWIVQALVACYVMRNLSG